MHMVVRDDGIGFDVAAARERAEGGASLGLPGMRERVTLLATSRNGARPTLLPFLCSSGKNR